MPWLLPTFTLPSNWASQRVEIWRKLQRYGTAVAQLKSVHGEKVYADSPAPKVRKNPFKCSSTAGFGWRRTNAPKVWNVT